MISNTAIMLTPPVGVMIGGMLVFWVGLWAVEPPYLYKIGDCFGSRGVVMYQVTDHKNGYYWLDPDVVHKETVYPYLQVPFQYAEAGTEKMECLTRYWR